MRIRQGLMGIAVLALLAAHASAITLVKDGKATSVIVIADKSTEAARIGADEMQYHLLKMSGAKVPIKTESEVGDSDDTAMILIGGSSKTEALDVDSSKLAAEGYLIRTIGNNLVIVGDDANTPGRAQNDYQNYHGTVYGVYDFLQDELNCQWIWPGVYGESIPQRSTVEVGDLDVVDEPALYRRHMRLVINKGVGNADRILGDEPVKQLQEDESVWYRRMRMGRSMKPPAGHSFTDWWDKYKDSNREVFAMLPNGERGPSSMKKPDYVKMCVANPAFWDLQLKLFKEAHERNPNHHELPCNENDGKSGFCTCDLCKAWDITVDDLPESTLGNLEQAFVDELTPGKDGVPESVSTRYAKWFNEMARRVREIDPDGYVTGYAYTRFREVPLGIDKLEPNMLIGYVGFNNYPRTMSQRAIDRRDYLGWAHPGVTLYIRPNAPHYSGNGHPYNVARDMADDLKFAIENGTIMADYDSMLGYWAAWGPTYYVVARVMWEGADADTEQILDEWFSAFGPAERPIREYYDFWEQYILSVTTNPSRGRLEVPELYSPEVMARARKLLDRASTAAADANEAVKERIKNIEMCLTNTELSREAVLLARDESKQEELKAALQKLIAHRREMAPRNVINVYMQTSGEMGSGGYWKGGRLGWDLVADYEAEEGPLLID